MTLSNIDIDRQAIEAARVSLGAKYSELEQRVNGPPGDAESYRCKTGDDARQRRKLVSWTR